MFGNHFEKMFFFLAETGLVSFLVTRFTTELECAGHVEGVMADEKKFKIKDLRSMNLGSLQFSLVVDFNSGQVQTILFAGGQIKSCCQ